MPALLVVLLVVSGCGRSSFVGRQYDDFTAYYNKFHNAEAAFEENVESIRETDRLIDRTRYLPLFLEPSGASDDAFEPVIQKSADVLREHPNSKWVDDALLMIGRSYYYQENYAGAAQKFREVIDLGSERVGEARFWLARALIANERYDAADEALAGGLGSDGTSDRWAAQMQMARGELLARQEQWEAAEQALSQGLEGDLPDRLAARGAFLLGQVRQTLGDVDGARDAYQAVLDHDPRYALAFAARLSDVELQGRHGDSDQALNRLQDLEQDDKNYEMRGQMALVRARILRDNGQPDAARRVLRTTMYGDEAPSGQSQGRLQYELATLYRDAYEDFSAAAAHFDSVQVGGDGQNGAPRRLPTAPTDVEAQANRYRNLADRAREVTRLDSLLRLGRMSEAELQSFVADLRERRRQRRENQRTAGAAGQRASSRQFGQGGTREVEQRQEAAPATQTRESDAGFLFHNDPARVQQGRQQFRQTWGSRPRADNWRRQVAIRQAQSANADEEEEGEGGETEAVEGAVGEEPTQGQIIDLSAVPRDSASQAQMEGKRAVARYELANALFLTAHRPDSAATWYQRIIQEDGEHPMADRARYALAEVRRAQGDTAAAREAYRRVIATAPNSSLAARARERLGESVEEPEGEATVSRADTAYARAYKTWQGGRPDSALTRMLDVTRRYPETPAAPRALLASSVIYWHQMQEGASVPSQERLARVLPALDSVEIDRAAPDSTTDGTGATPRARPSSSDSLAATPHADTAGAATSPRDTTAAPESRTKPADPLTSEDVLQDSTERTGRRRSRSPADPAPQRRVGDSARTSGRPWTLVVASLEKDSVAQFSMRRHRSRWADADVAVRLCRDDDRARIGVGRFATEEAALAARKTWADRLPDRVWTHQCEETAVPTGATDTSSARDTMATPSSSSPQGGERYLPLEAMLTYLTSKYPEAPQAARAEAIIEVVRERRREADSLAAAMTPARATPTGPSADTSQVSPQAPPPATEASSSRSEGRQAEPADSSRRRPPDPESPERDSSRVPPQSQSDEERDSLKGEEPSQKGTRPPTFGSAQVL